jgi:hypothetical protein
VRGEKQQRNALVSATAALTSAVEALSAIPAGVDADTAEGTGVVEAANKVL